MFVKVKAMGDEISDSCKLMERLMFFFSEAKLFWGQNAVLMGKKVQSVGYNTL